MQNSNKTRGTGPLGGSGMVALWGASSLISNIQTGSIALDNTTSATATITSVDTTRSIIVFNNYYTLYQTGGANGRQSYIYKPRITLTNATTVTAYKNTTTSAADQIPFVVIEFLPGVIRSVQLGTISNAGAASATATITSVNTAKSFVMHLGSSDDITNTYDVPNFGEYRLVLTNATTVTASSGAGTANAVVSYQVVEFF